MSQGPYSPMVIFLRRWWSHLPGGRVGRAVATVATGSAAVQVLGVLVSPITARVFDPAAQGVVAVFLSLTTICSGLAFLRYEQAVPLPATRSGRAEAASLCLWILPWAMLIFALFVLLGSDRMARVMGEPAAARYLWVLPFSAGAAALLQVLTHWFTREGEFKVIVRGRLRQSLGQIGFQIGVGALTGGSPWALVLGNVTGSLLAMSVLLRRLPHGCAAEVRRVTGETRRAVARRYRRFPLYASWSTALDLLAPALPVFVLAGLYGTEVNGWYRMAQTLVTLPIGAVSGAIMMVYWGEAARLTHENPRTLLKLYHRITVIIASLAPIVIAGAWLLAKLVPVLFGRRWTESGTYALVLAFPAAFSLIATPSVNLSVLGYNHLEAVWVVARIACLALATWYCSTQHLDPIDTLSVFACVLVAAYGVLVLLNFTAIRHYIREREFAPVGGDPLAA